MTSWLLILPTLGKNFLYLGVCISFYQFFFVCLIIIDTFLCFLGHLEHDFPCAAPSACLTWKPREVPWSLASSIKLSMCFQALFSLILLQEQKTDYSTPHQCNVFHRFCFRCYYLGEDCSMTISRFLHLIMQSTQQFLADNSLDHHYHSLFVLSALKFPLLANF